MPIIISWSMWTSASTFALLELERLISSVCSRLVFRQHPESSQTLAPLVQLLRTRGIRVLAYLDDWIICADSPEQSLLHTRQTIQLLHTLGWAINWKTSILEPSRILDFFGLHINLEQAIVSPLDSFLDILTSVLSRLSASTVMSERMTFSITGRIFHFAPFIHHGRLHLRFLQFWIKRHWLQHTQSWDTQIQLDAEFLTHLWWFNRWEVLQGVPLHPPEPTLFFFTDVSLRGWGASWQTRHLSRLRSHPESSQHINWLELETIQLAVLQWGPQWHNQTDRVYCNNSTAVAYIRKHGGTHPTSRLTKRWNYFNFWTSLWFFSFQPIFPAPGMWQRMHCLESTVPVLQNAGFPKKPYTICSLS